jgi:mono/diheme cytochrome c family protein
MSTDTNVRPSAVRGSSGSIANRLAASVCLTIVVAVTAAWSGTQLHHAGGGFSASVYAPFADRRELEKAWPVSPPQELGRRIYEINCQVCHQANGLGIYGQFPPLAGSEWVAASSPNRIIRIVLNGATGPIEVAGGQFNNTMVHWRDTLNDDEISAVLTFVRGNKDWDNHAPPVKPEDVKAIRDKTTGKVGPWIADDLRTLGDKD